MSDTRQMVNKQRAGTWSWESYIEDQSKLVGKLCKQSNDRRKLNHLISENFVSQIKSGLLDNYINQKEREFIVRTFKKLKAM